MSEGWICPVCKCGVAPTVERCPCVHSTAVPFVSPPIAPFIVWPVSPWPSPTAPSRPHGYPEVLW